MQGSNLREWLTNVNELHRNLQNSLTDLVAPEFWCVDDPLSKDGVDSMIFHYYSQRGSSLASLNVGVVKQVAKQFFNKQVTMVRIATQDVDESPYTTWRIIIEENTNNS